ncbi:MAG: ABC transporter substrate-binding protein [Paenibacillus macerans]|uniref:ABC transporter substrate-binding protein n=1 Tax=Paenibacillus macerans TaxID=44252 RepID=UPI002909FDC8|nr:ABC transporter substrate-binding protein [Paenibacillus macerans]MDU7477758.1 ABC transporter substrate-binding protein [Paenibacillus macerans]
MKRTRLTVLMMFLLTGALVLSACTGNNGDSTAQEGGPVTAAAGNGQSTAAAGNGQNAAAANDGDAAPAAALQFTPAGDLSKLPAVAKQRTDTIIVGLTDPSGAFTPYFHQSGYDGNVSSLLFTPLVTVDDKGLPAPGLAESYDVSADQLTYTFHLRKDLKFSDGSPLTADDVAFTWTLLHDKAYDGDSQIPALRIEGGEAYKADKAGSISGITVIDPLTVSAKLEQPNATALVLLGGDVLSKAYYGKDYKFGQLDYIKKLHEKPLGNGPYVLEKFIPGQEVRYVANEHYYAGKPKTERFIYKTSEGDTWQYLETGEVDYASFSATTENIDKLKSLGFVNILPYTPSTYGYLQLNLEHEPLKDKKVRQALTYGLDRQSIYVDANQGAGQVANIPASPISWAYTEEGINDYAYNADKANKLLDEAGWTKGQDGIREKNGKKLTIHFLGSKNAQTDIFIAVAAENFAAIGVDFQPEVFADFNALVSKVEGGDYDIASFSTPMLTDPSEGVVQFVDGEIKGYDNPKVKELYDKALATSDIEQRKAVYKELFQLLNDELPVIFTSYKKTVYAYNGRIQNLSVSPFTGLSSSLPNWTLQ